MSSPRALVVSMRNIDHAVFHAWRYELEDILAEIDDVDLIAPSLPARSRLAVLGDRAGNGIRRRLRMRGSITLERTQVTRDYDVLFMACTFPEELAALDKLDQWRARARTAVCFIGEVWSGRIEAVERVLPILRKFDHIFLHVGASLASVARVVGRPCHHLPVGVDAIRFCPYPAAPDRTVDCYSYGRRSPATHQALLKLGKRRRDFFYVYDTANAFSVIDHSEHRALVANIAKRSRYLISYKHSANLKAITGGEEALGPRFLEGTAAGAVVLGIPPACPEFDELLGWTDSVIPIPFEAHDIEELLRDLDAQPDRLERARMNNVVGALERNDWAHRWQHLLGTIGLKPQDGLRRRLDRLHAIAESVRNDTSAARPSHQMSRG